MRNKIYHLNHFEVYCSVAQQISRFFHLATQPSVPIKHPPISHHPQHLATTLPLSVSMSMTAADSSSERR